MVDKLLVKEWIKEHVMVAKTLYATDDPKTITLKNLPSTFLMKANNGCDRGLLIKNGTLVARKKDDPHYPNRKATDEQLRSYAKKWLESPYKPDSEKQYSLIKPMILFEEYLEDLWLDVELYTFYGKVALIKVIFRDYYKKDAQESFYDPNWNLIVTKVPGVKIKNSPIDKPPQLEKMVELAELLTHNIDHVRIDFSLVGQELYFMEFTFTSCPKWVAKSCHPLLSSSWH